MNSERTQTHRLFAASLLIAAAITAAYWIAFFAPGQVVRASQAIEYLTFQYACIAPDAFMAGAFVVAAVLLLKGRPAAAALPIYLGAGAMTYLALLDFSFNLVFGTYSTVGGAVGVEMLINIACVAYSTVAVWYCRRKLSAR